MEALHDLLEVNRHILDDTIFLPILSLDECPHNNLDEGDAMTVVHENGWSFLGHALAGKKTINNRHLT